MDDGDSTNANTSTNRPPLCTYEIKKWALFFCTFLYFKNRITVLHNYRVHKS